MYLVFSLRLWRLLLRRQHLDQVQERRSKPSGAVEAARQAKLPGGRNHRMGVAILSSLSLSGAEQDSEPTLGVCRSLLPRAHSLAVASPSLGQRP